MFLSRVGKLGSLAVIALLALAACDSGGAPAPTPTATSGGMEMTGTPTVEAVKIEIKDDLQFIERMVSHHQLAVDMGKLAQQKATRNELKGLAGDIILTQEDEIRRMNLWRAELGGGPTATPDPHNMGGGGDTMGMPGMDVDLDELARSPNFDRDFIQAMIPHHQSAIDMARAALPNLKHEPLRGLAQDIITTQQVEIDRMKKWLEEWK